MQRRAALCVKGKLLLLLLLSERVVQKEKNAERAVFRALFCVSQRRKMSGRILIHAFDSEHGCTAPNIQHLGVREI
jgi:hypothetical protein